MKLLILYQPNSEYETTLQSYIRDFGREHDIRNKVELISLNTRSGAATAELYDITTYPAILAVANDGSMLSIWQGMPLPMTSEIAAYL